MRSVTVRGQVDGLEGAYLVGWAVRSTAGDCVITVRAPDGSIVGRGRATRKRPDLEMLGVGKTNIAFRVPIKNIGMHRLLTVFADDIELGLPVSVGLGLFNGAIRHQAGVVEGWVTERTANFEPPFVTILDHRGRVVGEAASAFPEVAGDPLFTPAEFSIELADSCFGQGETWLTAHANGAAFATTTCNLSINGRIESLSQTRCSGWLFSPEAPGRVLSLDILVNGEPAAKTRSDISRADVNAVFPQCVTPGFEATLPRSLLGTTDLTTVSVRLRGDDVDVLDGPHVIGSAAAVVASARRSAQILVKSGHISEADRAVAMAAFANFLAKTRQDVSFIAARQCLPAAQPAAPRLNIIIPVYRGTQITATCIHSVLANRNAETDWIVLVNDCSPEADMAGVLNEFATNPNVFLLTNDVNLGFVKSVNRGLRFCTAGDVILLNSDTEIFPGGLDELSNIAHQDPNISTVTAISNNATIFSYPHATLRKFELEDISWSEVAERVFAANRGLMFEVPTGHGFCLLIKREALSRVGLMDEVFGKGYGEENDFCSRAADLGHRNVVAAGVFVRHLESVSFLDKSDLLANNLTILQRRYPEYTPTIMEIERTDSLRSIRWPLDMHRLSKAAENGKTFAVVFANWLGGGTHKAINDIEAAVGYGAGERITVECRNDGYIELKVQDPLILAVFAPTDVQPFFDMLSAVPASLIVVHQLLGFTADFCKALGLWVRGRNSVYYAHDFYTICPRVTMIDAAGDFCDVAATDVCARCLAVGGAHDSSKTPELSGSEHRLLFEEVLDAFRVVIAPSPSAASYIRRVFPHREVAAIPHPEVGVTYPARVREGSNDEVVLLGALGPHKGSAKLLEIAQRAQLAAPLLRFRVIGHTDIDDRLKSLGNVVITGPYRQVDLERHLRMARGRMALFLPIWPETYSYTLSESVAHGLIPVVPDIGAPADRVRESGFGLIFSFPIDPMEVIHILTEFASDPNGLRRITNPQTFKKENSISRTRIAYCLDKETVFHEALS